VYSVAHLGGTSTADLMSFRTSLTKHFCGSISPTEVGIARTLPSGRLFQALAISSTMEFVDAIPNFRPNYYAPSEFEETIMCHFQG
jgi:hypothetical protein